MAYNLRTGLTGSGDIDINVSLDNLDAANITSGTFADARISDLNAAKLTGTLSADRIADESIPKAKIGETLVAWAETEIPTLPKTKILSGANTGQWDTQDIPDLSADKIVSEQLHVDRIPDIPTSKLTGTIASTNLNLTSSDIPELPKSKISSTGEWQTTDLPTIPKFKISTAETWALADIPNLPTTKITSGTLDAARIPNLSALKITSDTLSSSRIPNLDASKITTGTIDSARLPATASECLMLKAVGARYGGSPQSKTINTTFSSLDSNLSGNFTAPPSEIVTVSLKFYVSSGGGSNHSVIAQLIKGGTSTEFVEAYSLDDDGCKGTKSTYVVERGAYDNDDQQVEITWVIDQLTSGSTYAIDAQVRVSTGTKTCFFGASHSNLTNYPPIVFRVDAAPSNSNVHIYDSAGGQ